MGFHERPAHVLGILAQTKEALVVRERSVGELPERALLEVEVPQVHRQVEGGAVRWVAVEQELVAVLVDLLDLEGRVLATTLLSVRPRSRRPRRTRRAGRGIRPHPTTPAAAVGPSTRSGRRSRPRASGSGRRCHPEEPIGRGLLEAKHPAAHVERCAVLIHDAPQALGRGERLGLDLHAVHHEVAVATFAFDLNEPVTVVRVRAWSG
jgi:hypothetical protein